MVLSLSCLSLYSLWNDGDGLWLTILQEGEERYKPGNSCGYWAKLMSCSKCENAGVELMPRAFYCLLNVLSSLYSYKSKRIYGAGKPCHFYPR